jgi:flagellar protein FlaG
MTMQGINGLSSPAPTAAAPAAAVGGAPAPKTAAKPETKAAPAAPPTAEQVDEAVETLRKALEPVASDLRFSVDQDTGKTVVKVMDAATQEVIRQIPTEEALAISQSLDRMQGVLIKQKA